MNQDVKYNPDIEKWIFFGNNIERAAMIFLFPSATLLNIYNAFFFPNMFESPSYLNYFVSLIFIILVMCPLFAIILMAKDRYQKIRCHEITNCKKGKSINKKYNWDTFLDDCNISNPTLRDLYASRIMAWLMCQEFEGNFSLIVSSSKYSHNLYSTEYVRFRFTHEEDLLLAKLTWSNPDIQVVE